MTSTTNGSKFMMIPQRPGETDEEGRMRESINRQTGQLLQTLDAAIGMRNAPPHVQRARHLARGDLLNFSLKAMHTLALKSEAKS